MKTLIILIFLTAPLVYSQTISKSCKWCIAEDKNKLSKLKELSLLPAEKLIKKIEDDNIKILIFKSNNKTQAKFFKWGDIRIDSGKMLSVSKYEGTLGKTFCRNEIDFAKSKFTIVLSSDSPYSTLIHEYMHVLQIENDSSWCDISKRLWNKNPASDSDYIALRNHEWDVRVLLWKIIDSPTFNIEDKILIAEGLLRESKLREPFDPAAKEFTHKENVSDYLSKLINEYSKKVN